MRAQTLAVLVLCACRVSFPDDGLYTCVTDADCGGGGFTCIDVPAKHCCLKTSDTEVCADDVDNDCDGNVDGQGRVEVCNTVDDNCDGRTDEGFNLVSDRMNCGACGTVCRAADLCTNGRCVQLVEDFCNDGQDNDANGTTDCADPGCLGKSCGVGCACGMGAKAEADCNDTMDNDGDSTSDCFDADCTGRSCGTGCTCQAGGAKSESSCFDALDNDGDLQIDCNDSDCVSKFCSTPPLFFTCNAMAQCRCNDGVQVAEVGSTFCTDGLDNDCNGKTDCAEAACTGMTCMRADAGVGVCGSLQCQ